MSIVDLPTFGKGGRKHGRSVDAVVRGDGSKRQKATATKKSLEGGSTEAAISREKGHVLSERVAEAAKGKS